MTNSNLTAERLRFRHKRSAAIEVAQNRLGELVNITEAFTILNNQESEESENYLIVADRLLETKQKRRDYDV